MSRGTSEIHRPGVHSSRKENVIRNKRMYTGGQYYNLKKKFERMDLIQLSHDRVKWWSLVNKAINLHIEQKVEI
jgi:hypothetical protein